MGVMANVLRATEEENRRVILDTMPPRPGARLLDLGCGNGLWSARVAAHVQAGELHGVDFIDAVAEQARRNGVSVVVADLSNRLDSYADGSFDVIHSNQVIEHLSNTDGFLTEIRRLLRPDGYAVISTNNLSSWHNILSLVIGWQPMPSNVSDRINVGNPLNAFHRWEHEYDGQTHLRVFTGRALSELARYHGLRPTAERGSGYYPFPPKVAKHLARLDRRHAAFLVHRFERA